MIKYSNNAATTLASAITGGSTSLTVVDASEFPTLGAGDELRITLSDETNTSWEIVKCTAIVGNTLTIVRAQESTNATSWAAGDNVSLRVTAGGMEAKADKSQVLTDVPAGALFTDTNTVYTHPSAHPISLITGLQTALNNKVDDSQVLTNVPSGAVFTDTNTTYSVGDGGLSEINFTSADHTKLNGIETGATADQTAAQLLTAIKTVDGSGTGLDADTVDGKQAAQFFTSPTATASAWEQSNRNFSVRTGGDAAGLYMEESDGTFAFQLYGNSGTYGFLDAEWSAWDIQKVVNGTFKVDEGSGLQRVWNAGNDGSGSGLDADLLDGQQGSYYSPAHSHPYLGSTATATDSNLLDGVDWNSAEARRKLGLSALTTYDRNSNSTSSAYHTGVMGWGQTNFDTLFTYGSGHIDTWSSPTNRPSTEATHWVGHQSVHHYASTSSRHGHQFAVGVGNPAFTYLRGVWGSTFSAWAKMWNSANDGSGSGLDADLLDGQQGSYYAAASNYVPHQDGSRYTTDFNTILTSGFYNEQANATNSGTGSYAQLIVARGVDTGLQIYGGYSNTSLYFRGWASSGATFYSWKKIWNDHNDGSGSGLDADLLDGQQGSYYYPASNPNGYTDDLTGAQLLAAIKLVDSNGTAGINAGTMDGLGLHTGRNNVANRVVRTNSSGYADFGWINTTSGVASGTPTRIYCSQDSYLRYYTPATLAPYILNQGSTKNAHVHPYLPLSGGAMTGNISFPAGQNIIRTTHSSGFLEGSYNNVGGNGTKSNPIYTIGSNYNPTDTALSNMYGIGYSDAGFTSMLDGWGMYVAADGDARIGLSGATGRIKTVGTIYADGLINSAASVRAPIFYDSGNTAYYVDPSANSYLYGANHGGLSIGEAPTNYGSWNRQLNVHASAHARITVKTATRQMGIYAHDTWHNSGGGYVGTYTNHNMTFVQNAASAGYIDTSKNLQWNGGGSVRSPIFYDSDNTAYYTDPASTSISGKFRQTVIIGDGNNNTNNGGWGARLNVTDSAHSKIEVHQSADGVLAQWYAHTGQPYTTFGTSSAHDVRFLRGGTEKLMLNSTGANLTGNLTTTGSITVGNGTSSNIYMSDSDNGVRRIHNNSNNIGFLASSNAWGSYCTDNGDWRTDFISYANASMRSPIFYDKDNTAYYTDPQNNSNINTMTMGGDLTFGQHGKGVVGLYSASKLQNVFTMGAAYKLTANGTSASNHYGIAWSHPNAGSLGGANNLADHGMIILQNGVHKGAWGGGSLRTPGDVRAPIFYDINDTGYYVNPAGTSKVNRLDVDIMYDKDNTAYYVRPGSISLLNDLRANIFYSKANTAYYTDPESNSHLNTLTTAGSIIASGAIRTPAGSTSTAALQIGQADTGFYQHIFGGIIGILCSGVVVGTFNQGGIVFNKPLDVTGAITASGNISANSDKRLKTNIETIPSALEKVNALRGVTFDMNGERGLGVIAQETEAVIPEVVMTADDEMGTKSVAYGNMVGLLIEAIKEQQVQIDELKLKVGELT